MKLPENWEGPFNDGKRYSAMRYDKRMAWGKTVAELTANIKKIEAEKSKRIEAFDALLEQIDIDNARDAAQMIADALDIISPEGAGSIELAACLAIEFRNLAQEYGA